ncbi:MAG: hypothetical protein AB1644_11755 [Candidatus Zixiibacteriota bacterium]
MKRTSFIIALSALLVLAILLIGCGKDSQEGSKEGDADTLQATAQRQADESGKEVAQANEEETKSQSNTPPPAPKPKPVVITIPESTQVQIALADTVQTNENVVGDQFTGTVAKAVTMDGRVLIPEGAQASLVITKLVKGGTMKTSPEMEFTVKEVVLADGQSHPVVTDAFYEKGRSHTAREVGMIGGGAAAGAVIGAIAGDKKGAVIGAAVGAAAGTGAAAATGRQNLKYVPGQTVTFTTQQPVRVTLPPSK